MNAGDNKKSTGDHVKWPIYVGPVLGVISADVLRNFVPHMDSVSRQIIVTIAAAVISILLLLGIYKAIRNW